MIDLQQDPDVTSPTLALVHQAAEHVAEHVAANAGGRVAVGPPGPAGSGPVAGSFEPDQC